MRSSYLIILSLFLAVAMMGCSSKKKDSKDLKAFESYPTPTRELVEMEYSEEETHFMLWSPAADEVRVMLYDTAEGGHAYKTVPMTLQRDGTWTVSVSNNLLGKYYTFNVKINDKWLGDTPGIFARAVGVNGNRAAIIDMNATNPKGWETDKRPLLKSPADIILYEMHHRDFSVDSTSGIRSKGKYLALTEQGTKNSDGLSSGLDHLKELGVTHVHLLPSFDFASIDESQLSKNKYNWGYDPKNYNVPEGSYSTDPYHPTVRIKEFKEMVYALHKAGIRVVMDVVYNHTFNVAESNFEKTVPGYFYRHKNDTALANGSGCGNETASERPMMRKFMVQSVLYWIKEYHIDGFRFDLMGIHDVETMNEIRKAVDAIDPSIYIYGEGWAAQSPQYAAERLAMKANIYKMPGIAAFSDELRDALRGPFNDNHKGGFLSGVSGNENSIKFGLVGGISHPQVHNDSVNYSKKAWALQPTQMISYVSCHDDMCLVDRLNSCVSGINPKLLERLDKLAQTVVFMSQGVPFIYAGEEVMRDKKGIHNSFDSPDNVNAIDWRKKKLNLEVFNYYKELIALRKSHPAFRMGDADMIRRHLVFLPVEGRNLVAFRIKNKANGDRWANIIVAFNGRPSPAKIKVPAWKYTIICNDGKISLLGLGTMQGPEVTVAPYSALIIYQ